MKEILRRIAAFFMSMLFAICPGLDPNESPPSKPQTVSIVAQDEIIKYADKLGLEVDPEKVVKLVVKDCGEIWPSYKAEDDSSDAGQNYVLDLIEKEDCVLGDLLKSETYRSPRGEMILNEQAEVTFESTVDISASVLAAKTGQPVGDSVVFSENRLVGVPNGLRYRCDAYVKLTRFTYWVSENGTAIGTVEISEPTGLIFVIYKV